MGLGDASAGLGLHHRDFLPKKPINPVSQEALFSKRYRKDFRKDHVRAFWRQALRMPATLAPCSAKRRRYRQKVLLRVGLTFRWFCFCCGWLARCAAFVFSTWFLVARAPGHKTLLFTVVCHACVSGLACKLLFFGWSFWGLWCARDPM